MNLRKALFLTVFAALSPSLYAADLPVKSDIITVTPFPRGGDFRLQSPSGPVSTKSLRGRVVLLFFGYTYCPDICPTTLATLLQATQQLTPAEQKQVQVVFVSVDPERDTPTSLRDYVSAFAGPATGLTGTATQVAQVADQYGAQYFRVDLPGSAMGYAIDHSAAVYLIDKRGKLQLLLRHTAAPERFVEAIRGLL